MIRIGIEFSRLVTLVDQGSANWRRRARERHDENIRSGCHVESRQQIWSEIKPVLIRLQHSKCAYCERRLESTPIEWDVEHFRPKGKVAEWQSDVSGVTDIGGADEDGYYHLAYELANYLVACKPCNTNNKKNFFRPRLPGISTGQTRRRYGRNVLI